MALAKVFAFGLYGLTGTLIEVEADISAQLPNFILVGLPDASLAESTSRVRAACGNSGFNFPSQKIVVNLSPAAVPKSGSGFDLAIAVSVLTAMGKIPAAAVQGMCFLGELGLDGSVRAVPGVLPVALAAKQAGLSRLVVPAGNAGEASLVAGIEVWSCRTLGALVRRLNGEVVSEDWDVPRLTHSPTATQANLDLSEVVGQAEAVEGLIVAAAGGHHLSMIGAPGSGKTMLAERLPGLLPQLSAEQAVELAAIESVVGDGQRAIGLNRMPRFQAPHHSVSRAALIGGGTGIPRPGSVSLAHHGVLFLDEALEFQSNVLEGLREPLESGSVLINRTSGSARYPAKFQLVLAANPCPCGLKGNKKATCKCNPLVIRRYSSRLSGPILDRIDIRLNVQSASISALAGIGKPLTSTEIAAKSVAEARAAAAERLIPHGVVLNAHLSGPLLRKHFHPGKQAMKQLDSLAGQARLSMRGYDRCLRLAWTLADLDGATTPNHEHVARAVALRGTDSLVAS